MSVIPLSPLVEKCKVAQSPAKESLQGFFSFWESAEKRKKTSQSGGFCGGLKSKTA